MFNSNEPKISSPNWDLVCSWPASQSGREIFSQLSENFFSYNTSAKNIYIHFIHYHNRSKCNLLTKNLNYSFSLCTISKDDIMKVFYCPWISNRSKTLTKHKIKLTFPTVFKYKRIEPFFFKFVSSILNIGFLQIFLA